MCENGIDEQVLERRGRESLERREGFKEEFKNVS
jgi:hypothetical protein